MLTHVSQAERDPEEEGDYMAFEQLMAESMKKQDNKKKDSTSNPNSKQKEHASHDHHHHHPHMRSHKGEEV